MVYSNGKNIIRYIRSLGIEVNTSTKARGHQGFFMKKRIDISKNLPKNRLIPVIVHEFAHYIHSKLEPDMLKTGGSLSCIFNDADERVYKHELFEVTKFVDGNAKCEKLKKHKQAIKNRIQDYEMIIKQRYPDFMRSKNFKEFDSYIKKSKARYLLKYDRVQLVTGWLVKKKEFLSIANLERDFADMPKEFIAYIRLKSCQKKQSRISTKINKLNKYYTQPSELFARLVEGLYIDSELVRTIAPHTYKRFFELLKSRYYFELSDLFDLSYNPNNFSNT